MATALQWTGDDEEPVPASFPSAQHRTRGRRTPARPGELPPEVQAAIWRGNELGSPVTTVVSSGFAALDAELPGSGWPCHSLTEVLQPQPTVAEWRLLAPAIRQVVARGGNVVVVGPPKSPHLPGLRHVGLDERHLVWIQAETPAERLWVTEQLVKTNAAGLLVSWLPQARQEQIRRLQVCAQACDGPVFLCRPAAAEHEPSAAP
ncbi:MAG: translesion DNA synthesis-associated protein ImuA, partial [Burkholderiales bacterium]|nr:translesion DNA synthesis-associated protein ImuA [Burkholderiales bacterium]